MQTHQGAAHHQRVAHVVTGIAVIHQMDALQITEAFLNGHKVRQDLGGVELIGQAVPNRNRGILRQLLHHFLTVAAVFNAVIDPGQNPGSISNGFLAADLGGSGIQISGAHTQVVGGHLKTAAGAGAGLFKDQRHILALAKLVGNTSLLLGLQLSGQIQQFTNLCRREIQQLQKISTFQTHITPLTLHKLLSILPAPSAAAHRECSVPAADAPCSWR